MVGALLVLGGECSVRVHLVLQNTPSGQRLCYVPLLQTTDRRAFHLFKCYANHASVYNEREGGNLGVDMRGTMRPSAGPATNEVTGAGY